MKDNLLFDFIVDKTTKTVTVSREFAAELSLVWDAYTKQEQQGREIYYSLEIERMIEIDNWLNQFRKIWETRFSQLDELLSTIKGQKNER